MLCIITSPVSPSRKYSILLEAKRKIEKSSPKLGGLVERFNRMLLQHQFKVVEAHQED